MKDKDIHKGLDKKEIRDFLGKELTECVCSSLEWAEKKFKEAEENLKDARKMDSIKQIMKELGWKDFDVSDLVEYDQKTYFDFIGTVKEVKKFEKDRRKG